MADHSISIDVIANGIQETVSLLKEIRDDIKTINSTPVNVKVNTAAATRSLNELRKELSAIANFISQGNRNNSDAMIEAFGSGIEEVIKKMTTLGGMSVAPKIDTTSIDEATVSMDKAASTAERLAAGLDIASGITGSMASVFSGLGDFGNMFANSFDAMSGMFKFDAVGTASRYLTAMATRAVTGQISGILERYDIMSTFVPYMSLAGVDEFTAQSSLNAVDQSIRGIPIGLDEAAFRLRKYQMYMNDIDRATKFTIGIQKAITAGGASNQMRTTAYTQIDRLLATGKLGQSRQWLSLFNGLGVSLRFLREELALDPTADLKQIASDLADGTIETEDFIDAITRLADNEGLDKALEIYKGTIEAWRSNINNAIKRGGQGILDSVNGVLEDVYGQGITGFMKNVRDGIDTVSADAKSYIKENPQNVQGIGDAIGGLIERAMSLDGGRFVGNLVENIKSLAGAIGSVFDSLPPGTLEDFTAFATTWAGPMAAVMKAASSGIGVVFGVFERMNGFDMPDLLSKITGEIENMAGAVAFLLDKIPDGLLGDLMAFGLVWGKPLASVLRGISSALKDMSGALGEGVQFSDTNGIIGQLTWLVANHPLIMGTIGAVAGIMALVAHNVKEASKAYDEFVESAIDESGLGDMQEAATKIAEEAESIKKSYQDTQEGFNNQIDTIRSNAADAQDLLEDIIKTDEKLGTLKEGSKYYDELSASQQANLEKMRELQPEFAELLELDTQGRLKNIEAIKEQGSAYIDYLSTSQAADAAKSAYRDTYSQYLDARANERRNLAHQWELNQNIMKWSEEVERNDREIARNLNASDVNSNLPLYERNAYLNTLIEAAMGQRSELQESYKENHQVIKDTAWDLEYLQDEMFDLEVTAKEIGWSNAISMMRELGGASAELVENINPLTAKYLDLRDAAEEALVKQQDLFKELKTDSETTLSVSMKNIGDNLGRYGDANRALISIREGLAGMELPGMTRSSVAEFANSLVERGELGQIIELGEMFESGGALEWITNNSMGLFANTNANQGSLLSADNVAQLQLLKEVGGNLEQWTAAISETDISSVIKAAGDAAAEADPSMTDLSGSEESVAHNARAVATNANAAAGGIDKMGDSAQTKSGAVQALSGTTGELSGTAQAASTAVGALADAINRLQNKEVTIRVNVLGHLGSFSKGGMAGFYASGGNVLEGFPGMASGTDTIPAWLTPGEYVIRRSAVGMFGSRLMDRINKMDIGGAFDALMTRISNPMMHGNTYNRDNHATVNNYFYGDNGQNYSQRKAYRYVGSL